MLTQSSHYSDVKFDNDKISVETVQALLSMGNMVDDNIELGASVIDLHRQGQVEQSQGKVVLPDDDQMDCLVNLAVQDMALDPQLKTDLDSQSPETLTQLKSELASALQAGLQKNDVTVTQNFSDYNKTLKNMINYREEGDVTHIILDGEVVMQVSGANRGAAKKAVQAFFVVLDVFCLVYAILSMPQCKPARAAIEDLIKKFGSKISQAANKFISAISSVFGALRKAQSSGGNAFVTAVKNAASAISRGVVTCVKFVWSIKDGVTLVKDFTLAVFSAATSSVWKALYYVGQFVLGLISLIAGPAAMAAKIANLVSALLALVVDSIALATMESRVHTTRPAMRA